VRGGLTEHPVPVFPGRSRAVSRRIRFGAGRPPLRKISRAIEGREDLKEVTASQETIRRMLTGTVLSTDLDRVYAVFRVLCEMGDVDPDAERWDDNYYGDETNWQAVGRLWDIALEEETDSPAHPNASGAPRSMTSPSAGTAMTWRPRA
jgi:hypothetical protein